MGSWRVDQHKLVRRRIWGQTRGQNDETWADFSRRAKAYPVYAKLRFEKIGTEIHGWKLLEEDGGEKYWMSCLRFVDDGWGYWTVFYRNDERRWRTTDIKKLPIGKAVTLAAALFEQKLSNK